MEFLDTIPYLDYRSRCHEEILMWRRVDLKMLMFFPLPFFPGDKPLDYRL